MRRPFRPFAALATGALTLVMLAGCGSMAIAPATTAQRTAAQALNKPNAEPLVFVTIKAKVIELLPDDTHGLPHQNFVVEELSPAEGLKLTVNHDTKYGQKVDRLKLGAMLTIRGVKYHNGNGRDGIHWTHHKDVANDAGFIQTADGVVYQ